MWVNYYSNYLASFITCQWLGASSLFNKPIKNWLSKSQGQLCTGWQWWGERESHRHCQDSSWVRYKTNGSSFLMVSDETERNCSQQLFVPRNTRIWTQLSLTSDLREGIRVPLGQWECFCPGEVTCIGEQLSLQPPLYLSPTIGRQRCTKREGGLRLQRTFALLGQYITKIMIQTEG